MRKRVFDLSVAFVILVIFSPIYFIACILILISSSGPILLKEKKMGKGFFSFSLYRFRCERRQIARGRDSQSTDHFPKIPFLQKQILGVHFDTLPIFLNVLKGEMSLVGPQPQTPAYVKKFKKAYQTILRVAPGMTYLSPMVLDNAPLFDPYEISGESDPSKAENLSPFSSEEVKLPKALKLAKAYVKNQSFILDLKILFATLSHSILSSPSFFRKRVGSDNRCLHDDIFKARAQIIFFSHFLAILGCNYIAFLLRFDAKIPSISFDLFLETFPIVVVIRLGALYLCGLNRGLWRYAGLRDLLNIVLAIFSSTLIIYGASIAFKWGGYPRSIYLIDSILLVVVLSVLRSAKRIYATLIQTEVGSRRILIIGAGTAGEMILRNMTQDRRYDSLPVAFVDDDTAKHSKSIHSIPVIGNICDIEQAVEEVYADEILIAIPSASTAEMKKIIKYCKPLNRPIKTLPNLPDMIEGKISVTDIRPLDIEDLIGRAEIRIQDPEVAQYIRGKRVLITGGGGSIGSELCRQVASFQPEALIIFERNENNLYQIEIDLLENFPGLPLKTVLADICDTQKVDQTFFDLRPQIIFHAAAYKHVPMMERCPLEAVRNNILGTYQLIMASDRHRVETFVLISTDKAVSPSSIMGATKRVGEMMVRFFDAQNRTKLVSVRFGNVLESNGSIVPIFRDLIKKRKPLKVTHPKVQRYFISLPEAVQLVLQSSILGKGGEVFVLDMGKPIKILDLAKTMITLSGLTPEVDIPIQIIGLRPGEKLHEGLFEENEIVVQTRHEKVRLATGEKISLNLSTYIEQLLVMNHQTSSEEIKSLLKELVPTCQWEGEPAPKVIAT